MKKKIVSIISVVFVVILLSFFIVKFIDEDSWICTEKGWIEHGKPSIPKPITPCGKTEIQNAVQKYLEANISQISLQKEVLGGKFYITKINWSENNSGIVEYEDGHIALKASFDYTVNIDEKTADYSVIINNFKIIN